MSTASRRLLYWILIGIGLCFWPIVLLGILILGSTLELPWWLYRGFIVVVAPLPYVLFARYLRASTLWFIVALGLYYWTVIGVFVQQRWPADWPIWTNLAFIIITGIPYALLGIYLLISGLQKGGLRWGRLLGGALVVSCVACAFYTVWGMYSPVAASDRCFENIGTLSEAFLYYQDDHGGRFPDAERWVDELYPYVNDWHVFKCPAQRTEGRCSYAMNANLSGKKEEEIQEPQCTVLLYETAQPGENPHGVGNDLYPQGRHHMRDLISETRHNNFIFADLSARCGPSPFKLQPPRW